MATLLLFHFCLHASQSLRLLLTSSFRPSRQFILAMGATILSLVSLPHLGHRGHPSLLCLSHHSQRIPLLCQDHSSPSSSSSGCICSTMVPLRPAFQLPLLLWCPTQPWPFNTMVTPQSSVPHALWPSAGDFGVSGAAFRVRFWLHILIDPGLNLYSTHTHSLSGLVIVHAKTVKTPLSNSLLPMCLLHSALLHCMFISSAKQRTVNVQLSVFIVSSVSILLTCLICQCHNLLINHTVSASESRDRVFTALRKAALYDSVKNSYIWPVNT